MDPQAVTWACKTGVWGKRSTWRQHWGLVRMVDEIKVQRLNRWVGLAYTRLCYSRSPVPEAPALTREPYGNAAPQPRPTLHQI